MKNIHLEVEAKQLIKEKEMMQEIRSLLERQRLEMQAGFQVLGNKIDSVESKLEKKIEAEVGKVNIDIGRVNDNFKTLRSDMLIIKGDVGEIKGAIGILKGLEKT